MNYIDYDQWFNNTVISIQVHTNDVMVAEFKHPGTILNRITYTFLSSPKTIAISGDIAPAVFYPTWNPVKQYDYSDNPTGYILGKLECCKYPEPRYSYDSVESDWCDIAAEYEDDPDTYKAARRIIDECVIPNMDDQFNLEHDLRDISDDPEVSGLLDTEDIWNIGHTGARASSQKLIYVRGLHVLQEQGAFDKSVNSIVVGNPDEYRR